MSKLVPISLRQEGRKVTGIVTSKGWVSLLDVNKAVADSGAQPISPDKIKTSARRILLYEPGKPPMPATVRKNPAGIHVRIDGAGGTTYETSLLEGKMFVLDYWPVLAAHWINVIDGELAAFQRKRR